jgi:DNA-binding transcriptional MerR regulator
LEKAPDAFRTISEVAEDLDVPQHVLRFWESRFPQIKPMKRAGGRRYYRPDDVDLLRGIKHLLYGVGYTIRGVQGVFREKGPKFIQQVWQSDAALPAAGAAAEAHDNTEQLAPDEAARAVFGLLQAPDETPAAPSSVEPVLTREQLRRLQSALHELSECRRLIDDALKDEAA